MKNNNLNQNGFSFTFDGLIAIILLAGIITFIASTSAPSIEYSSQNNIKKSVAYDTLKAAIDLNKLQTFNETQINSFFYDTLPPNYDYLLVVKSYSLTNQFNLESTNIYGNQTTDLNYTQYVETKKMFLTFSDNNISFYNSATIRTWVK